MNRLADDMRAMRKTKGFTQEALAEVLGVTRNYIAQLETSRKTPSIELVIKLCVLSGQPIEEVVFSVPQYEDLKRRFQDRVKTLKTTAKTNTP